MDLAKERYGSADLHTRIHLPFFSDVAGPKGEVCTICPGWWRTPSIGYLGLDDSQHIGRSVTCIVSM